MHVLKRHCCYCDLAADLDIVILLMMKLHVALHTVLTLTYSTAVWIWHRQYYRNV